MISHPCMLKILEMKIVYVAKFLQRSRKISFITESDKRFCLEISHDYSKLRF